MLLAYAITVIGEQAPWFWPLVGGALGAVSGSLITCLKVRLPVGESPWNPPSRCDNCHTTLTWPDLVPVLSCLLQRARCRHCGKSYGWDHMLVELICVGYGAGLGILGQPGPLTPLVILCGLSGLVLIQAGTAIGMQKRHTPAPE